MKKTLTALLLMVVGAIGATAEDAILSALTDIKTEISGMKTDISGMKTDISGMRTDISGMRTDISGIKTDVAVINTRLERLDVDVQSIFDVGANVWSSLLIGLALAGGLALIKLVWSAIANKNQKETHAIQSSGNPEPAGLRPKQRTKTRPAT